MSLHSCEVLFLIIINCNLKCSGDWPNTCANAIESKCTCVGFTFITKHRSFSCIWICIIVFLFNGVLCTHTLLPFVFTYVQYMPHTQGCVYWTQRSTTRYTVMCVRDILICFYSLVMNLYLPVFLFFIQVKLKNVCLCNTIRRANHLFRLKSVCAGLIGIMEGGFQ